MPQQVIIPGFPKYGYLDGVHTIATNFQHFKFLSKAFFVVLQLNRFQFYIVTSFFFMFPFLNRLKDIYSTVFISRWRHVPYMISRCLLIPQKSVSNLIIPVEKRYLHCYKLCLIYLSISRLNTPGKYTKY